VREKRGLGGLLFVVSGPSGSGKTTLLEQLFKDKALSQMLVKSVSCTTRPKRSGERNHKDYVFISPGQFKQKQKTKKILEWTKYLGYYYATPKDFLESAIKSGRHVVLCLDVRGALKIKRIYPKNTVTIFIFPPSLAVLRKRIEGRCNRTKAHEVRGRLEIAKGELAAAKGYDYCLLNKNLLKAAQELKGIILKETCLKLQKEKTWCTLN